MMSDGLNTNKEDDSSNPPRRLTERKICTKFVPHEQKQRRLTSCQDFIQTNQDDPNFLDCTVTGDESWVYQYDPEAKLQGKQ
jgi:hypothetical protein